MCELKEKGDARAYDAKGPKSREHEVKYRDP